MPHPKKYSSQPLMRATELLDSHFPPKWRRSPPETVLIFMDGKTFNFAHNQIGGTRSRRIPAGVLLPSKYIKGLGIMGQTGVGGAAVVARLEFLAAWGVKRVVLIGTAGGLTPAIHYEDIVVPSKSYRDDGVSDHYLPHEDWALPDHKLNQTIIDQLAKVQRTRWDGIKRPAIHEAPVWTTPAPFRETKAEVKDYGQAGMVAVEMETASLFAAAHVLGMSAAAVLVISDSLATGQHQLAPKRRDVNGRLREVTKSLVRLFNTRRRA